MPLDHTFFHPKWPVLHTDNHLFVVYKPAGLLTQSDRTGDPDLLALAKQWIQVQYAKPGRVFLGMVHRLDRPVAGVLVFARTSKAAARLSDQFRTGRIRKEYVAVAAGRPEPSAGTWEDHVVKLSGAGGRIAAGNEPGARLARLHYRVRQAGPEASQVDVDLETGRRHQIRLQFSHRGHPLLGDLRYGVDMAALPHRQIALFARSLTLDHPTRREPMTFSLPLPVGWPWADTEESGSPVWTYPELVRDGFLPDAAHYPK